MTRVALTLEIDATHGRPVTVMRVDPDSPLTAAELVALREWLGRASPGDYIGADGVVLPAKCAADPGAEIVALLKGIDGKLGRLTGGGR